MSKFLRYSWIFVLATGALPSFSARCYAQSTPTASGTLNVQLLNGSGLVMTFQSDANGVALGNSGTSSASLAMGNVSAAGALSSGVTRTAASSASFTVSTPFDVVVQQSGLSSMSYTLSAYLAAAAPTGLTYLIDSVPLSTTSTPITKTGSYGATAAHALEITVSTASSSSGGPQVATPLTSTINFTATSN